MKVKEIVDLYERMVGFRSAKKAVTNNLNTLISLGELLFPITARIKTWQKERK